MCILARGTPLGETIRSKRYLAFPPAVLLRHIPFRPSSCLLRLFRSGAWSLAGNLRRFHVWLEQMTNTFGLLFFSDARARLRGNKQKVGCGAGGRGKRKEGGGVGIAASSDSMHPELMVFDVRPIRYFCVSSLGTAIRRRGFTCACLLSRSVWVRVCWGPHIETPTWIAI